MSKKLFVLVDDQVRKHCANYIMTQAPAGHHVKLLEPVKKRVQEEKYHAMIGDIAKQTTYAGRTWPSLDMKRILIDEFAAEMREQERPLHHDSRIIPSEDGKRIIQLEIHSSEFYVKEASDFIEFLYAWGSYRSVNWSEPVQRAA